jgi:hypothetical protein
MSRGGQKRLRLHGSPSPHTGVQVLSTGLAEFGQEVKPTLAGNLSHFLKGAVWSQVGLDDVGLDPLGRNDHCRGRYQAHTPDQGVERYQTGDVIRLAGQGIYEEARSLRYEVVVERLQLGPFAFAMRSTKLRPLP